MMADNPWEVYAKRVAPLAGKRKPSRKATPQHSAAVRKIAASSYLMPRHAPPVDLAAPVLFDRRTERRLREGAIRIDARIDLHGLTQERAYNALAHFMASQVEAGSRKLLIITGQGRDKTGALRSNLAGWLESLSAAKHIIDLRPAAPRHGGDGAFYVWLKKGVAGS